MTPLAMNCAPWRAGCDPDYGGIAARAWKMHAKNRPAMLGAYLIHAPGAAPVWHWRLLSLVHLRPIPGVDPPFKKFPEAGYEFGLLTLNPEVPAPDPRDADPAFYYLTPPDWIGQAPESLSDKVAVHVLDTFARACCDGLLIPDSDFAQVWDRTFELTLEHLLTGGHDGKKIPPDA